MTTEEKYDNNLIDDNIITEDIVEKTNTKMVVEYGEDNYQLSYLITNLFKDDSNKYRSRRNILKDPPKLYLIDSENNEVEFNLTEEFTRNFHKSLGYVVNAYDGNVYLVENNTPKEKLSSFIKKVKDNPVKYSIYGAIIIGLLILILK